MSVCLNCSLLQRIVYFHFESFRARIREYENMIEKHYMRTANYKPRNSKIRVLANSNKTVVINICIFYETSSNCG